MPRSRSRPCLAAEHVGHRQDSLQSVALASSGRADVGFARRNPDVVVDDAGDGFGRNAGTIVLDTMRVGLPLSLPIVIVTLMTGAISASSQASMPLSTNSLMTTRGHSSHSWPVWATILLGAEFHEARGGERHPFDLVRRLIRLLRTPDTIRRGFRPNRARATLMAPTLQPKAAAMTELVAAVPHLPQPLLPLGRPADARLNIGKLCKNFRSGLTIQPAESCPAGFWATLAAASPLDLRQCSCALSRSLA